MNKELYVLQWVSFDRDKPRAYELEPYILLESTNKNEVLTKFREEWTSYDNDDNNEVNDNYEDALINEAFSYEDGYYNYGWIGISTIDLKTNDDVNIIENLHETIKNQQDEIDALKNLLTLRNDENRSLKEIIKVLKEKKGFD